MLSRTNVDSPLPVSQVFVLENFASNDSTTAYFDFNLPFTITFYNYGRRHWAVVSCADLQSDPGDLPERQEHSDRRRQRRWSDPAKAAGHDRAIAQLPGNTTITCSPSPGSPTTPPACPTGCWLLVPRARAGPITVDTDLQPGGSFGGVFGGHPARWGTVTFSFPTCGRMNFTASTTATPAHRALRRG